MLEDRKRLPHENREVPSVERFGAPYFFFSNDERKQLTYVSDSIEDVLGFRAKHEVGRKFDEFLVSTNPVNQDAVEKHTERFQTTDPQIVFRAVLDPDGNERMLFVQTYGEADRKGKVIRSRGCAQDITRPFQHFCILRDRHTELRRKVEILTAREQSVLDSIVDGKLNKQIAVDLAVCIRTVEMVRSRIVKKLGVDHIHNAIAIRSQLNLLSELLPSPEALSPFLGVGFDE